MIEEVRILALLNSNNKINIVKEVKVLERLTNLWEVQTVKKEDFEKRKVIREVYKDRLKIQKVVIKKTAGILVDLNLLENIEVQINIYFIDEIVLKVLVISGVKKVIKEVNEISF